MEYKVGNWGSERIRREGGTAPGQHGAMVFPVNHLSCYWRN